MKEKIVICCDHGGVNLKKWIIEYLKKNDYEYVDVGSYDTEPCDYPIYAKAAVEKLLNKECDLGILLCGTGQGMAIMANRYKGIRAVVCTDIFSARASRTHNDANVLCLGERVLGKGLALELVDCWLTSKFEGGRHKRRVDMFDNL